MTATRPGCDFCCSPKARWAMSCRDIGFIARARGRAAATASLGAWTACDGCQILIQRNDLQALAERVAGSKHAPDWLLTMTTKAFRIRHFYELYGVVLP